MVTSTIRPAPLAATLLIGGLLAGCGGDQRLDRLTAGISKDSTLAIMGVEKPKRVEAYLSKGHYIEALYYYPPGKSEAPDLADRQLSPVIVIDGVLAAWGWRQWDSIAGAHRIVVAK